MAIAIIENSDMPEEYTQHLEKVLCNTEAFITLSEKGFALGGDFKTVVLMMVFHIDTNEAFNSIMEEAVKIHRKIEEMRKSGCFPESDLWDFESLNVWFDDREDDE